MIAAGISSSLTHQVAAHGAYAVFVLMAIDAVFPAASELVMLYAGAVAGGAFTSSISIFGAHVATGAPAFLVLGGAGTVGYLAGALVGWWAGRRGGRALVARHGQRVHLDEVRFARAEQWLARWGTAGVLLGRLTPLVRSFVSIPAGVLRMPVAPYTLLTLAGSAIWCFALAGCGWALGTSYRSFDHGFRYAEYAVVAIVLLSIVALVLRRLRRQPTTAGR